MSHREKPQDLTEQQRNIKNQIREHKAVFAVYVILRIIVIASLALALIRGEYESAFVCVLTLVLFLLPHFVERTFAGSLPGFLAAFLGGRSISEEEAEELKRLIDEHREV